MAHIEGFGGREGIKKGKSELYDWLSRHNGLAFVNADEEFLSDLSAHVKRRVFYGTVDLPDERDYRFKIISSKSSIRIKGISPNTKDIEIESALFGEYNARNILTAVAIGLFFGVDESEIRSAIRGYLPDNNRSQVIKRNDKLIVLDAYNANPTSMHLALESFVGREGKKAAILGGMNELGEISGSEHRRLVEAVAEADLTSVYLVGEHFDGIELADGMYHFRDVEALCKFLKSNPVLEELILVKGSRSLRLESALDYIH
jgi:UDP-N-acetylmuramoyl-tripeptide--D-alanyl-D-alanine ligase